MKALVAWYLDLTAHGAYRISAQLAFINTGTTTIVETITVDIPFDGPIPVIDSNTFIAAAEAAIIDYANNTQSYGITAADIIWNSRQGNTKSFANPSRTLNSAFQISTSRDAAVSYAVDMACTLSLTTGQQGTIFLEYADDSGFTTNVIEVNRFVNGNTGTLTIGLALTQNSTGTLSGIIPAGKYARLRTQNNTGTPTFTFRRAQEVLL